MAIRIIEKTVVERTLEDGDITGADLAEMGDLGSCELIEGRIVKMSPTKIRHGRYEFRLAKILNQFIEARGLGEVMVGEVGIYVQRNPDSIRAADILYISHERLAQATPDDYLDVAPELVVEIMSPSDRWTPFQTKLRQYLEIGVDVVLVVEPDNRVLTAFRSPTAMETFGEGDTLVLNDILPGFSYPVAELFK